MTAPIPVEYHLRDQARWLAELLILAGGEVSAEAEQMLATWEQSGDVAGERTAEAITALEELAHADREEAARWTRRALGREHAARMRRARLRTLAWTRVHDMGLSPVWRVGRYTVRLVVGGTEAESHVRIEMGEAR